MMNGFFRNMRRTKRGNNDLPTDLSRLRSLIGRLVLPLLALASLVSGCALPPASIPVSGTLNFHRVDARLFRSAQPEPEAFPALAQQGIKTVINLRTPGDALPTEEPAVRASGLDYRNMPLSNWGRPTDAQVTDVLSWIETAAPPVLVHCERGADRTGTIVACYRIRHDGWTAEQALAEAEQCGMGWWQLGMKAYVRDFAQKEHAVRP